MQYTHRGTLGPQKPRLRYRPPRPRRVVDGLLLVGGRNGGGRFLKTGRSMRYTCRESLGPRKPRFRYRPPHPGRAVDGLLLVGDQNDGGRFFKRGGRCGIPTGEHWGPENRASAIDHPVLKNLPPSFLSPTKSKPSTTRLGWVGR